jgi:hypothetical protein
LDVRASWKRTTARVASFWWEERLELRIMTPTAPSGPHLREPDAIDDDITFTNRLEKLGLRGFSVEAGVNAPVRSNESR